MTQYMTFAHDSNTINVSELFSDGSLKIAFRDRHGNGGSVVFNQGDLRELQKWLSIQQKKFVAEQKNKQKTVK